MSKIEMIKGDTTPEVFCAHLTEIAEHIEDIAVVIQYKNGTALVFSTPMNNERVSWMKWVFDHEFNPHITGVDDDDL